MEEYAEESGNFEYIDVFSVLYSVCLLYTSDILLAKKLGFNGIRMHQKVESNVFYYLCDKLGMYVWGEIPSAYEYTDRMKREFGEDCLKIVRQLKVYPLSLIHI